MLLLLYGAQDEAALKIVYRVDFVVLLSFSNQTEAYEEISKLKVCNVG